MQTSIDRTWDRKYNLHYQWAIGEDQNVIYQKEEEKWNIWEKEDLNDRNQKYSPTEVSTEELPDEARPCTVRRRGDMIHLQSVRHHEEYHDDEDFNTPGWTEPHLTTDQEHEAEYARRIKENNSESVSNGSYKNRHRTTSAFVVLPDKKIHGANTIPGEWQDQSSYRGKLEGILTSIMYTNSICKHYNITKEKCRMYCDNKGALSASFGWKRPNPRWSCYDLVSLIRLQIQQSPIKWEGIHIKGHQDDYMEYDKLDYIAQGNVDADRYAEEEMDEYRETERCIIKGIPWHLSHCQRAIAGNIEKRLRLVIHEENMKEVWRTKFGLPQEQEKQIFWGSFTKNNKAMDKYKATSMTKYNQRIGLVKKNLERRGHSNNTTCPCCNQIKDTDHLLRCQNTDITKVYEEEHEKNYNWLEGTAGSQVATALRAVCQALREETELEKCDHLEANIRMVAHEQIALGQRAFIGGWWSRKWRYIQQRYATRNNCRHSPRWMANAISKYQDLIRSMWKE